MTDEKEGLVVEKKNDIDLSGIESAFFENYLLNPNCDVHRTFFFPGENDGEPWKLSKCKFKFWY